MLRIKRVMRGVRNPVIQTKKEVIRFINMCALGTGHYFNTYMSSCSGSLMWDICGKTFVTLKAKLISRKP